MSEHGDADLSKLELEATIGFSGNVPDGLKVHPDKQHLIYSVGSTVVIEEISNSKSSKAKKQDCLQGHTDYVTCLAVSKSGKYIASGQQTHMGFKSDVIIWDFYELKEYARLKLHNRKVEALAFSPNDKYLVTLGGMDDGSVVVWNIEKREAICGSPAQVDSAGKTNTVAYANGSDFVFVTGGERTLRVWDLDVENRKIRPTEVAMGNMIRHIKCIEFTHDDSFFYCGTTTGDILAINMQSKRFQKHGPKKQLFGLGVTSLCLLPNSDLLVGAGDGIVCVCKGPEVDFKRTNKCAQLQGAVMSIAPRGQGHQFYVGTDVSNVYRFSFDSFKEELVSTCHYGEVNDIIFPYGWSDVFITCAYQDIRVWGLAENKEFLRISVPNMTCNVVAINKKGSTLLSGWNDGIIRAYGPETGKLKYQILNAHSGGVTALACFKDGQRIISGGKEGHVRVWITNEVNTPKGLTYTSLMLFSLQEHKAQVTCIKLDRTDARCISASTDGTCIIWDLVEKKRHNMFRMNTLFKYVCFQRPDYYQILTVGTDRNVSYWELADGSMIRSFKGSEGAINALDISPCGTYFVSGGEDKIVRVWKYMEGEVIYVGLGHSGTINRLQISPCGQYIVSCSSDGAIMRWRFPCQLSLTEVMEREQDSAEQTQYSY